MCLRLQMSVLAAAMIACGGDGAPNGSPLSTDGPHLRDADGRVVVLRGVNARVEVAGAGGAAHGIYIPERAADSYAATCDDSPIIGDRDPATGLIHVACDGILEVVTQ